ncbi:MAG TPA: lytic transglycosylase domain-containing protein [bacterium]|nr:lytic transglycosylase domain-containing protein [bacterium]
MTKKKDNIFKYILFAGAAFLVFKFFKGNAEAANASKSNIESLIDSIINKYNDGKYLSNANVKKYVDKIIKQESGYKNIVGSDGQSMGIMQVIVPTAQWMLNDNSITKDTLLNDIELNLTAGIKYFLYQLNRYTGSVNDAIMAYNLGTSPYQNPSVFSDASAAKARADKYLQGVLSR